MRQGRHFKCANSSHIENYSTCLTALRSQRTKALIDCEVTWAEAYVQLHSVENITGSAEHPKHYVLLTAGRAVVVPRGSVDPFVKQVGPLVSYDRKGNCLWQS